MGRAEEGKRLRHVACFTLALALGGCVAERVVFEQPVAGRYTSCAGPFGPCLRLDLRSDGAFRLTDYYRNPDPSWTPTVGSIYTCGTWYWAGPERLRMEVPTESRVTSIERGACSDSLRLRVVNHCGYTFPGYYVEVGDTTLVAGSEGWITVPKRGNPTVSYPGHVPLGLEREMGAACEMQVLLAPPAIDRVGAEWRIRDETIWIPTSSAYWLDEWPLRRVGPPVTRFWGL